MALSSMGWCQGLLAAMAMPPPSAAWWGLGPRCLSRARLAGGTGRYGAVLWAVGVENVMPGARVIHRQRPQHRGPACWRRCEWWVVVFPLSRDLPTSLAGCPGGLHGVPGWR